MPRRIDLLLPPSHLTGYGVLPHFTRSLYEALGRVGANCRILGNDQGPTPDLTKQLLIDPPDCTLSFNGLLPDSRGRFFCDVLEIPHFAFLVDSPNHFFPLLKSPMTIISCIDRDWVNFFRSFKAKNVLFVPHAAERDVRLNIEQKRTYDAVFLGTCFDFDEQRDLWKEEYGTALASVLDSAVEIAFLDETIPYFEAFMSAVDRRLRTAGDVQPAKLNIPVLLQELEFAIRGIDRIKLLQAITDTTVHVFGGKNGTRGWKELLKGTPHIVHAPIPYVDALDVISQSKFVLNSCPSIRDGAHERIFSGFLAGSGVITNVSTYVKDKFVDGKEILFYHHSDYSAINEPLRRYLDDEPARQQMVSDARKKVLGGHTWDYRAKTILTYLDRILPELGKV